MPLCRWYTKNNTDRISVKKLVLKKKFMGPFGRPRVKITNNEVTLIENKTGKYYFSGTFLSLVAVGCYTWLVTTAILFKINLDISSWYKRFTPVCDISTKVRIKDFGPNLKKIYLKRLLLHQDTCVNEIILENKLEFSI